MHCFPRTGNDDFERRLVVVWRNKSRDCKAEESAPSRRQGKENGEGD